MMKPVFVWVAIVLAMTMVVGCGGDDTPTTPPPLKATVVVNATPDGMNCPWQLTGPSSYSHNGQNDETLSNLTPGDYTLTWQAVTGWNLPVPSSETKTVAGGGTVTFSGTYLLKTDTLALHLTQIDVDTTGYVRIPDDPALEPQVFTLEAWITPRGPDFGMGDDWLGYFVIGKPMESMAGSWLWSWMLTWSHQDETVSFSVTHQPNNSGANITSAAGTVPLDSTTHIAGAFDGDTLSLYLNGTLAGTAAFNYAGVYYGAEDVLMGAANFRVGFLRRFYGVIDEVRIWDHARSAGDIAAKMDCRLIGNESGLLAYWSFETGGLTDDSGNGHDGTAEATGPSVTFVGPLVPLEDCP